MRVYDASGNLLLKIANMANINNIDDVTITSAADHDMLYYDLATSLWKNTTPATILAQLSGQAGAAFAFNSQNVSGVGVLTCTNISAHTLDGKLTGGASEIEGSAFDINGGAIDGVTIGGAVAPTVTDLGSVATCDINGGTIAGVTIDGDLTWSSAQSGLTLTAPTLNGTTTLGSTPIFDAGSGYAEIDSTVSGVMLLLKSTQDAATGAGLKFEHITANPAVNDNPGRIYIYGVDGAGASNFNWAIVDYRITNIGDGTEALEYRLNLTNAGAGNLAMTVSGAGALWIDSSLTLDASESIILGDAGETIAGDGTDLTISSSNLLNLTATTDVVIPVNIGLHLGDGAEKLESNNTDLTINSGGDIALTATNDINIPVNVGLEFAGTEKIESDGTDLNITVGANGDINVGANIGVTFGDDGEKIEGDGTDLTISGNNINLTAVADVVVPANVGITFGTGEKIEGNNTDLTVTSGADIALTATGDVNIPSGVGVTFGDDGEKIEGDGTDLSITSSNILNVTASGGIALAEDTNIILDALLSADEHWSGIAEIGTMGYGTTTIGDLIYLAVADTKWELAKADAAATSKGKIGLCLGAVAENATCNVLLYGKMRSAAFPAFTVGAPVHISAATAGDMAVAAPTGTTNFVVRIIGYGNTAEDLFFCPDNTYIELA